MSTNIATTMTEHTASQFWGGTTRGVCLHVSELEPVEGTCAIQLTMEEAAALCGVLGTFVKTEATRRQRLLADQIAALHIAERTVFHEVAELPSDLLAGPALAVTMVSRYCPKAKQGEAQ